MQGKETERNVLAHKWCLIPATMPIVFMSEMVLSHLSSMVESSFSSLWLMHGQIVSRGNSTGLEHINILLDLSSTRDFKMLLCMIGMMEKILGLWDANSFFPLLMWGVLGLWPSCFRMLWPFADTFINQISSLLWLLIPSGQKSSIVSCLARQLLIILILYHGCHKLHLAISPSILHQFSQSQWLRKALKKTFRSLPVTSRGNQ